MTMRLLQGEVDGTGSAGRAAVERERNERPGLEEAHEEANREVRSDGGAEGAASRNAKRAASLCDSPTSKPPPIVTPERELPGMSASACAVRNWSGAAACRRRWQRHRCRCGAQCVQNAQPDARDRGINHLGHSGVASSSTIRSVYCECLLT